MHGPATVAGILVNQRASSPRSLPPAGDLRSRGATYANHHGGGPHDPRIDASRRPGPPSLDGCNKMNRHDGFYRIRFRSLRLHLRCREIAATIFIIGVCSTVAIAAEPELGRGGSALIFVLGISLVGAFSGLIAALLAALAASLLYNFYLVEPVLTLTLTRSRDIAPFVVFTLCALVTGALAGRLKDRAEAAHRSNQYLSRLLDVSSALLATLTVEEIIGVLGSVAPSQALLLFRLKNGRVVPLQPRDTPHRWWGLAEKVSQRSSETLRDGPLVAHRLMGSRGVVGIMVFDDARLEPWEPAFASALNNLFALALERAALSEVIAETHANARTEELKTALLSSVSHDFRTPLTAISAAASSLIDYRRQLDPETTVKLLRNIVDECDRLNRYTTNLLEMGRLESGQSSTTVQILGVSEVVRAVAQRIRTRWPNHIIVPDFGCNESLVYANAALFELVLTNVLDNAARYSPEGSRIIVDVAEQSGFSRISVIDEGSGIPEGDLERVFERFYRVSRAEPSPRGTGLGLAIAKGFVEALGGTIDAKTPGINRKGTRVTITLPLAKEPLSL
jgi:two-component system sensor histidine kinase KdpD